MTAVPLTMAEREQAAFFDLWARYPVTFESGRGAVLVDSDGREYLDFLSGVAVCSVGHAHPLVADAVDDQMRKLVHVSAYFYTEVQMQLAERVRGLAGGGRVFFGNSGAEANECAIKLARRHGQNHGGDAKHEIISCDNSFHGRTLATLAATGQPAKQARFAPLPSGFRQVPFNDIDALTGAIDPARTAGVMIEVIQGEGGVVPADPDFLVAARRACDDAGAVLIFDEIQTGLCRTGSWLGFQQTPVKPDVFTLGKAIANGLPLSACVAMEPVAAAFQKGDHSTTMMGGAVVCRAALAVLQIMEDEALVSRARLMGERLADGLRSIAGVSYVRGRGLLLGAVLAEPRSADAAAAFLEEGLVANAVTADVLRFAPPLVVTESQVDEALAITRKVLS